MAPVGESRWGFGGRCLHFPTWDQLAVPPEGSRRTDCLPHREPVYLSKRGARVGAASESGVRSVPGPGQSPGRARFAAGCPGPPPPQGCPRTRRTRPPRRFSWASAPPRRPRRILVPAPICHPTLVGLAGLGLDFCSRVSSLRKLPPAPFGPVCAQFETESGSPSPVASRVGAGPWVSRPPPLPVRGP